MSDGNGSITMQRIEGKGNAEEQRAAVLREKERSRTGKAGMDTAGKWEGRATHLGRAEERLETSSEASQRRQDRRRQPAITSWNVWERVGLDPKGPTTTKFPLIPLAAVPSLLPSTATP